MKTAEVYFAKEGMLGVSRDCKADDGTCDILSRTSSSSGH